MRNSDTVTIVDQIKYYVLTVRAGGRPKSGDLNGPEFQCLRPRPWPTPMPAIWPSALDGRPETAITENRIYLAVFG